MQGLLTLLHSIIMAKPFVIAVTPPWSRGLSRLIRLKPVYLATLDDNNYQSLNGSLDQLNSRIIFQLGLQRESIKRVQNALERPLLNLLGWTHGTYGRIYPMADCLLSH